MKRLLQRINVAGAAVLLAACASDQIASVSADTANQESEHQFNALVAEISPHLRVDDGSWTIDTTAELSLPAKALVNEAQEAWSRYAPEIQKQRLEARANASASASFSGSPANQSGIQFFWWGARIAVPSGAVTGITVAWRQAGAAGAVRVFLTYFGYSGWAVSVAGVLVPAYAITIDLIDRMGGRRGVYMYVPWSLVPTFIAAQ